MTYNRFSIKEFSAKRVIDGVSRRLTDIPHTLSWITSPQSKEQNNKRLQEFHNIHINDRCFIMGNGPSLKKLDLSFLKNEYTFGLNRIYLLFNEIAFQPTYYVCVNELVLEQFSEEILQLPMPKFLNWNRRKYFKQNDPNLSFIKLSLGLSDFFGTDITKALCGGGTVTYVAMQLAFYMGFREVILIGVDHNFSDKGTPNTTEIRESETDPNHFHPDYFPKGVRWQLPDLYRSELAYALAKKTFERSGRFISDATLDGKCQVFQKVNFYSFFSHV